MTLDNTPPNDPTSSSFNAPSSGTDSTIEITLENLQAEDQVKIYVNKSGNSNFLQNVLSFFSSNATNSSICVEANKVGSGTVASGKTEVTLDVTAQVGEHNYYATITDEAGNSSACVQGFTYRNTSTTTSSTISSSTIPRNVEVTGLTDDFNAGSSKRWNWSCTNNSGTCEYRHIINQNAAHTFTNEPYNSTTTATKTIGSASDNGTYYIHVQAKDSSNGNESIVKSVRAVLQFSSTAPIEVTGLTDDLNAGSSKRWNWSCTNNSGTCEYRHIINQNAAHTFTSEPYNSTTTALKTIGSANENGTYYIHVQAKDSSGNVSVIKSVRAILRISTTTTTTTTMMAIRIPDRAGQIVKNCQTNPSFNACIYNILTVPHGYRNYAVNILNTINSFLENLSYKVQIDELLRATLTNGKWTKPYNSDPNYTTVQANLYHWLMYQKEWMELNAGHWFASGKKIKAFIDKDISLSAWWSLSQNKMQFPRTGDLFWAVFHEAGHANLSYAHKGQYIYGRKYRICASGTGTTTNRCCKKYLGCFDAINEGQAEFHKYLIDPIETISDLKSSLNYRCYSGVTLDSKAKDILSM